MEPSGAVLKVLCVADFHQITLGSINHTRAVELSVHEPHSCFLSLRGGTPRPGFGIAQLSLGFPIVRLELTRTQNHAGR